MTSFKIVELFAGIGGFRAGLEELGGECVFASEIDKFAKQSYAALYGDEHLHDDITQIHEKDVPDHDILVGGTPCQSFSVAGKRLGFEDTRGTLFFDVARIAKEKQPKVVWIENVKGLVGHDKGKTLDTIVKTLNDIGYTVDFEVLNSKFYNVPQNRERIFLLGVRDDLVTAEPWVIEGNTVVPKGKRRIAEYEGIKTFNFDWPEQTEVTTRLRDVLEASVDEKYYLSEDKTAALVAQLEDKYEEIDGMIRGGTQLRAYEGDGSISPTLTQAMGNGGGHIPLSVEGLAIREATKQGYAIAAVGDAVNFQFPDSKTRRGRVGKQIANTLEASSINQGVVEPIMLGHVDVNGHDICKRVYDVEGVSPTLPTGTSGNTTPKFAEVGQAPKYRIRKLTPLECWRLQGFSDEAHQKVVDAGLSDSQRYKQAGNAVTVNVITAISERLIPYIRK